MKIIDVLTAPWAIVPEMYLEIMGIYERWMSGEKPDIPAIEAKIGKPLKNERKPYEVIDGVAVLPVEGILAKRMNMMMDISGGTSTELLGADFREAMGRPDVKAILLDINSIGGAVDGTIELAREIYNARGTKPIAALGDGVMASAAMYIGAAADEVYLSGEATQAGSIGVMMKHMDISKAEEMMGIKTTVLTAGKYKAIANQYEPLSQDGRASIQEQLDYIYTMFVEDMARFRGTDTETVLSKMADGKLFMGRQAVQAGLADRIMSREELIKRLGGASTGSATGGSLGKKMGEMGRMGQMEEGMVKKNAETHTKTHKTGGTTMEGLTSETLRAERPDLVKILIDEGASAGSAAARAEGAAAERERIRSVEAQSMPGHEALIQTLKFDGQTTGPEAAVQVLQAEKANNTKLLKRLEAEAPKPAAPSMEVEAKPGAGLVGEPKWQAEYEASEELQKEFGTFGAYKGFREGTESGRVKVAGVR